jgi:hypothetical protein
MVEKIVAAALSERGVPTPAGGRHWYAAQVARVLKRLAGDGRTKRRRGS